MLHLADTTLEKVLVAPVSTCPKEVTSRVLGLNCVHAIQQILAKVHYDGMFGIVRCTVCWYANVRRTLSNGSFDKRTVHQKNFINSVNLIWSNLFANERSVQFDVRWDTVPR